MSTDVSTQTKTEAIPSDPRSPWPRRLRRIGVILVALVLVFYGAGGWYFSTLLGEDAFVVADPAPDEYDIVVDAITAETITLRLGAVSSDLTDGTDEIVTRRYDVLEGEAPRPGDAGDLDSWVFSDDTPRLFTTRQMVQYNSDVGAMDAAYIPGAGSTWAILIHGKGAEVRETSRILLSLGNLPTLAINYRNDPGQPADPSDYYRYGATEWRDVEGAVTYALEHGAEDVILVGLSTGAALAMAYMYESDSADRVVAMVFDAPNIDFGRTVDYGASQRTLPLVGVQVPQSLATVAKLIGSVRYDVSWAELDYIDDAEQLDVPILVYHGTADLTVPVDVSERLAAERPDLVTLQVFDGAAHVQ